jgi:hypothetical protein
LIDDILLAHGTEHFVLPLLVLRPVQWAGHVQRDSLAVRAPIRRPGNDYRE